MNNLDIDINDGYFFSRKNLNAIKNRSKATKKMETILETPLKVVHSLTQGKSSTQIHQDKAKTQDKEAEPLLKEVVKKIKKIRNVVYGKCERTDLNRFFALKLKDFFPIVGF